MLTGFSFPRPHRRLSCPASADGGRAAGSGGVAANDNIARLRALSTVNVLWLAGRVTFALIRSVVASGRTVRLPALPNRALMVQPGPCAVIPSRPAYPLSVQISHRKPLLQCSHQSTGGSRDVGTSHLSLGKTYRGLSHDNRR